MITVKHHDPETSVEIAGKACKIESIARRGRARTRSNAPREVFERIQAPLYRFFLARVGGDRHAADELLQQTCYETARGKPPTDPDEAAAWMHGVARNLIKRHWRGVRKRAGRISLEQASLTNSLVDDMERRPLPPEALVREESLALLREGLAKLSDADRELIGEFYFEERSQAALSREAGVTEKCIESRLYRARGRLRDALRKMERSGQL